jgi:hypothetical protein
MRLIKYFNWPATCLFDLKMTKKVLKEVQPDAKEDLLDSIEKMIWAGALKSQQVQIPVYVDEEYCYDEVVFVEVMLWEKAVVDRVARLLQRTIPYPLVLGFIFQKEFCFQIAEKTVHKQQKDKRVVNQDKFLFSEWMQEDNLSQQQKDYLANLSLDKVGGGNLKEYFDRLMSHIFDDNRQVQIEILALQKKAYAIKNQYARENNAARRAELHARARSIADQINALKSKFNHI